MGAYITPEVGCFFLFSKTHLHCCFYISAYTEATTMIFFWGHRGYPPVHFEYETIWGIWLPSIKSLFWGAEHGTWMDSDRYEYTNKTRFVCCEDWPDYLIRLHTIYARYFLIQPVKSLFFFFFHSLIWFIVVIAFHWLNYTKNIKKASQKSPAVEFKKLDFRKYM